MGSPPTTLHSASVAKHVSDSWGLSKIHSYQNQNHCSSTPQVLSAYKSSFICLISIIYASSETPEKTL